MEPCDVWLVYFIVGNSVIAHWNQQRYAIHSVITSKSRQLVKRTLRTSISFAPTVDRAEPAPFPKYRPMNSTGTPTGTRLIIPPITCEAVSRTSRCGRVIPSAAMDTYQQYPSQMLMNWGVYLTDQGAMQGGQGVYSDPWSSPVSTVNTVNTVTSLLKNGQTIFNQDWNTVPINSYGTVSILFIAFLRSKMFKSI